MERRHANAAPTPSQDGLRAENDRYGVAGAHSKVSAFGSSSPLPQTSFNPDYVTNQHAVFEAPVDAPLSSFGLDSILTTCTARPGEGMHSGFRSTNLFGASSAASSPGRASLVQVLLVDKVCSGQPLCRAKRSKRVPALTRLAPKLFGAVLMHAAHRAPAEPTTVARYASAPSSATSRPRAGACAAHAISLPGTVPHGLKVWA